MPDHSSDAAADATGASRIQSDGRSASAGSHVPRTDWRLGGRSVLRWREWLLAVALLSLGFAIFAGALVEWLWPAWPWAATSASLLFVLGMLVPVVWGLTRSRPVGLLRLRALDLLYGVALGVILRFVQGWIEIAQVGYATFPAYPLIDGRLSDLWWLTDVVAVVLVAPLVEEFYFRAVILVSVYTLMRRPFGRTAAGLTAIVTSAAFFLIVHSLTTGVALDQLVAIGLLGLVCATLVITTGRIWGAVLVHVVYNATYIPLALAGTM